MMKRLLLCLLLCLSVAVPAWAETPSLTLPELRQQVPDRLTVAYEAFDRTVTVDAPIFVPAAEQLPILVVRPDWWEVSSNDPAISIAVKTHGIVSDAPQNRFDITWGDESESASGDIIYHYSLYPPYDLDAPCCPGGMTVGQILTLLDQVIGQTSVADCYQLNLPQSIYGQYALDSATGEAKNGGDIFIGPMQQLLCGVPVIGLASSYRGEYTSDGDPYLEIDLTASLSGTGQSLRATGRMISITDRLAEDVPLCSFESVRQALESEIKAGHIREIFQLQLGYVLYATPGAKRSIGHDWLTTENAVFYAVPMWDVHCLYESNPDKAVTPDPQDHRNSASAVHLLINAQTGELVSPPHTYDATFDDFTGFITWEDVR